MKKFLALLFCLLLLVTSFVMTSCDKEDTEPQQEETTKAAETTEEETTEAVPVVPDGYQMYDNGKITFAYPEEWSESDSSVVILTGANGGNNITVAYEAKTDLYEKMTTSSFISQMKPVLQSMGLTTSNETVTQTENERGLKMTKITYTATTSNATIKQTQYIVTVGDQTYTVTVTEFTADAKLVQTVFDTLAEVK